MNTAAMAVSAQTAACAFGPLDSALGLSTGMMKGTDELAIVVSRDVSQNAEVSNRMTSSTNQASDPKIRMISDGASALEKERKDPDTGLYDA